jgi:hypothetical protein
MIADFVAPASVAASDWASAYARADMAVFPCNARKKPLTPHGLKDATTDEAKILAWWTTWPGADIGWSVPSDVVVLDLDLGRGPDGRSVDGFRDFIEHVGVSPDEVATPQASTPRGGRHMLCAANGAAYKNGVCINGAAIDVRTLGGYIILPRPDSGREWITATTISLAPVPDFIPERPSSPPPPPGAEEPFSGKTSPYARAALDKACEAIATAENGEQEQTLNRECFSIGGLVGAGMLDKEAAIARLAAAALLMPAYAGPWGDLAAKVSRAVEEGMLKPREHPDGDDNEKASSSIGFTPTPFVWRDPSTFPRRQFVYGRHYVRAFLGVTSAQTKVGKSSLLLVDAVAMAAGRNLLGVEPIRPMRVWYWNGEDPQEEIERRILAICLHYKIDHRKLEQNLFVDNGRDTEIIVVTQTRSGARIAIPVEHALTDALIKGKFDVMMLDPSVSLLGGASENDNPIIDAVAKTFGRIAGKANVAIEAASHTRKLGGAAATMEDTRGASAWVSAARDVRVLNRMTKVEGASAGIKEGEERAYSRVDSDGNLAPPAATEWFNILSVGLGNGGFGVGEGQDHVGVVTTWMWPNAFEGLNVSHLRKAQAAVRGGRWRESPQAKAWVGVAIATALDLDPTNKGHRARVAALLKVWIANRMFVVVEGEDDNRNTRKFIEVGEPAND